LLCDDENFMRYALLLLALPLLGADQITMKNGDHLTGTIVKFDGKALTMKSEYAGDLVIKWEAVAGVTSVQPLNIGLKDGQVVVGTVTTKDDQFAVQTTSTGTVSAPIASITYIRSKDEEAAFEANEARYKNPRIIDLWAGNVALGYAKATGNSKTTNLNVNANAVRATTRDKTTIYFTTLYATSTAAGKASTTANAQRGGFNYDLNLTPKFFVFGGSDFEADQFQALDLRFTPGGGFGYHVVKNEKSMFDIFGGGTLDKEYYSNNVNKSFGEAQFGEEYLYKLSKVTTLHEKVTLYPNLSDTGQLRVNFDASADTKLRKWLAWQVSISDRYVSNPLPGFQRNDLIITTGVNLLLSK
jgi:putative salt-induced outer membrane protein YdiY